MATLILVSGSEGAGILHESHSLIVFGVHAAASAIDVERLDRCLITNIIVNQGAIIGQQSQKFVDGLIDGFYQANVIHLRG